VQQHNDGISKWTAGKGPWTLRWTSEANSIGEARKLENLLKRQNGGERIADLASSVKNVTFSFIRHVSPVT
jgi:predicted GIY-YIG superfamily endonuclease